MTVRLDPADAEHAVRRPHARPMDFTKRPMRGFVTVRPEGLEGEALARWVRLALDRVDLGAPRS